MSLVCLLQFSTNSNACRSFSTLLIFLKLLLASKSSPIETEQPSSTTLVPLCFQFPHPLKVAKGGEDAYFISNDHSVVGIFDGSSFLWFICGKETHILKFVFRLQVLEDGCSMVLIPESILPALQSNVKKLLIRSPFVNLKKSWNTLTVILSISRVPRP
jgi:hypothetical protein